MRLRVLLESLPDSQQEVTPRPETGVGALRYQATPGVAPVSDNAELLTVKLRYKLHDAQDSKLLAYTLTDKGARLSEATVDFRFAASVASFGMLLKNSRYAGAASFRYVYDLARESFGSDENSYRREFLDLVRKAMELSGGR